MSWEGKGIIATAFDVVRGLTVESVYEHTLYAAGVGLLLCPWKFVAPSLSRPGRMDMGRLLGVWVLCMGVVVRETRLGNRIPHYLLPLYFLLTLAIKAHASLISESLQFGRGAAVLLCTHFASLFLQTLPGSGEEEHQGQCQ
eukprot:Rhum_TRINITY_DN12927_c0_g1::Rhum_TRINITY_DN12927_c0_g1_i1::g.55499::m.55499